MKSNCYFDECKTCLFREHNDDLMGCLTNRLSFAWHKMFLELPIINKLIDKNKYCHWYEEDWRSKL